jgi:hypothetical protein
LEILKKLQGENNLEYATTLENLSNTLTSLGYVEKAKESYFKA